MYLKGESNVEWLDRMVDSIDYLENNMESKLDMDEAAKVAYSSKFHFQRMFHMLTGVTVAEYVRKRRLTLAAQELTSSDVKVIDVALKYGYQTPEAFTKAFQRLHGVRPSDVRDLGMNLKAYPRISFQIQVKGEVAMNYKIVEKEAFKIVGYAKRITTANGKNLELIPAFWDEAYEKGWCKKLGAIAGNMGLIGVCTDFDFDKEEMTYAIVAEKPVDKVAEDMVELEIPAANWAIFEAVGPMPDSIQNVWKRIFSEWFPATGYQHADGPELEVYPAGDANSMDYKCEVWIPVIKK